jgi:hypothetical protein
MTAYSGDVPRSLSDLYEELTRVKALLEYYALDCQVTAEERNTVVQIATVLKERERQLVLKIIESEQKL